MKRMIMLALTTILLMNFTLVAAHGWYPGWSAENVSGLKNVAVAPLQYASTSSDIAYWVDNPATIPTPATTPTLHSLYARVNGVTRLVESFNGDPLVYPFNYSYWECGKPSLSVMSDGSYYVAWAEVERNQGIVNSFEKVYVKYKYFSSTGVLIEDRSDPLYPFLPTEYATDLGAYGTYHYLWGVFYGGIKFYNPNHYSIGYTIVTNFTPANHDPTATFWGGDGFFTYKQVLAMVINGTPVARSTQYWTEERGYACVIEHFDMPEPGYPDWQYSTNGTGTYDAIAYGINPNYSYKYMDVYPGILHVLTSDNTETTYGTLVSSYSHYQIVTTDDNKIHLLSPFRYTSSPYTHLLKDQKINSNGTLDGSPTLINYPFNAYQTDRLYCAIAKPGTGYYDLFFTHNDSDEEEPDYTYVSRYRGGTTLPADIIADEEIQMNSWGTFGTSYVGSGNAAYLYSSPSTIVRK